MKGEESKYSEITFTQSPWRQEMETFERKANEPLNLDTRPDVAFVHPPTPRAGNYASI